MVEVTQDGPRDDITEFNFDKYFPKTMELVYSFEKFTGFSKVMQKLNAVTSKKEHNAIVRGFYENECYKALDFVDDEIE